VGRGGRWIRRGDCPSERPSTASSHSPDRLTSASRWERVLARWEAGGACWKVSTHERLSMGGPSLPAPTHQTVSPVVHGGFGCLKGGLRRVELDGVCQRMGDCPWEGPSPQAPTHRTVSRVLHGGNGCLRGGRRVEPAGKCPCMRGCQREGPHCQLPLTGPTRECFTVGSGA
jgi:hypothetical protein